MSEQLVRATAVEFFREQLERAMDHQKVSTSEFTQFYLVNLLAGCLRGELPPSEPGFDETPLALMYVRAIQASRRDRAKLLRAMGDTALFVSGFFGDSLSRSAVDVDYYIAMGGQAYGALGAERRKPAGMAEVFDELADRFGAFVDLFAEIAELSHLTSNRGLVKLYERFLATGSERAAELLRERGVTLVPRSPARKDLKH